MATELSKTAQQKVTETLAQLLATRARRKLKPSEIADGREALLIPKAGGLFSESVAHTFSSLLGFEL